MKKNILKLTVLMLILFTGSFAMAQNYKQTVSDLKSELKNSIFKSEIVVQEDGTFLRKDNNGNTFSFNMKDVDSFIAMKDGFHNVIITMKKGKSSVNSVKGTSIESDQVVFSFTNGSDCKKTLDDFEKLKKEFI